MDTERTPDNRTLDAYLTSLRSMSPTPGGGSAAAYAGAMGAGLLAMVCRLTLKSTDSSELEKAASGLDILVDALSEAARADEECYGLYRAAASLPKETSDEKTARRDAMQAALIDAANAPLASAGLALRALLIGRTVAKLGTAHALSDVRTAVHLLNASIRGSGENVRVNIEMIKDVHVAEQLRNQLASAEETSRQMQAAILEMLGRRDED